MRRPTAIVMLVAALALTGCTAEAPDPGIVAGAGIETLPDSAEQVADGVATAHATWFLEGGGRQTEAVDPADPERADWVIRSVCSVDTHVDYVFIPPEQVEQFAEVDDDLCPTY